MAATPRNTDAAPRAARGTRGVPREQREAAILAAATRLFGEQGHSHASVNAIAAEAGVSKALVLSYFGSKDDLYLRCVDAVSARVTPPVETAVRSSAPGFPLALATMHATFTAVRDHPTDWRLISDNSLPLDSPLRDEVSLRTSTLADLDNLGTSATMGPDADPLDTAALRHLWTDVVGSAMEWWFEHPDETPDTLTDRFSRIVASLIS